jgi:multisubunit Na+/H+ antiporter MnhG subunit
VNAVELISWALLAIGLIAQAVSSIGVLVASDAWERLHYVGPGTMIGTVAIAGAAMVGESPASAVKIALVAAVLVVTGPVVVHALGRALRLREHGTLMPGEWEGEGA